MAFAVAGTVPVACWSADLATETESLRPERATVPGAEGQHRPAVHGGAPAPDGAGRGAAGRGAPLVPLAPRGTRAGWLPPHVRAAKLASGLSLRTPEAPLLPQANHLAQLWLELPVGAADGAAGLAQLTAAVVADLPRGSEGQPSLRDALAGLGAALAVQVNSRSTAFAIAVPVERWRAALRTLIERLRELPDPPAIWEDVQQLARRLVVTTATEEALDRLLARAFGCGLDPGALLERDAGEVFLLHRLRYVPSGSVLSAWVPGREDAKLLDDVEAAVQSWSAPAAPPAAGSAGPSGSAGPAKGARTAGTAGGTGGGVRVLWAQGAEPCTFAVLLPLAEPGAPHAAAERLLVECLVRAGDGRLSASLRDALGAPAPLTPSFEWHDGARWLVLRGECDCGRVPAILTALRRARESLQGSPPVGDELRDAIDRAHLRLLLEQADPPSWLRQAARDEGQHVEGVVLALERALAETSRLDVASGVAAFLARTTIVAVAGGAPADAARQRQGAAPDVTTEITIVDLPPPPAPGGDRLAMGGVDTFDPLVDGGDEELSAAEARKPRDPGARASTPSGAALVRVADVLRTALAAAGGANRLAAIDGYSAVAITRHRSGPVVRDEVHWARGAAGRDAATGTGENVAGLAATTRVRRVREVLGTSIETVAEGALVSAGAEPPRTGAEGGIEARGSDAAGADARPFGAAGRERSDGEERPLAAAEARHELADAARHPLALLAACARGELRLRLLAVREDADRRIAVLEQSGSGGERLRLHFDVDSGLLREVEVRGWLPGIGYSQQHVLWSDYRTVDGVRVPFHGVLLQGGVPASETTFEEVVPRAPAAPWLRPGGPGTTVPPGEGR